MKISVTDGSNYFKGLLLLIRKDRKVTEPEIQMMKRIGKTLGFDPEFCEDAIRDILENKYIVDTPPVFSTQELAFKFIKDGLTIAFSDSDIHPAEEEWLRLTAEKNGLDISWFRQESARVIRGEFPPSHIEADDLTVEYS